MAGSTDLNGRAWATVEQVKAGDWLEPDGGFDCMAEGTSLQVCEDAAGQLSLPCRCGAHGLDGQLDDTEAFYVGLYLASAFASRVGV